MELRLNRGPLEKEQLRIVMTEIAQGLEGLHRAGVIRRQLTPESIVLGKRSVVLTDFELAKLLDGSPTVDVGERPDDLYVAPEIRDGDPATDFRADIFSWAMIMVRAATGAVIQDCEFVANKLAAIGIPRSFISLIVNCLGPVTTRPENMNKILLALKKWR